MKILKKNGICHLYLWFCITIQLEETEMALAGTITGHLHYDASMLEIFGSTYSWLPYILVPDLWVECVCVCVCGTSQEK